MGQKRNYLKLIPSLLVATSLILSACQDSGQSPVRVAKNGKGADRANEAMTKTKLTADQKQYDPLELPPYQKLLAPVFNKMDSDAVSPWSTLFRLKRWVIYPTDIKKDVDASVAVSVSAGSGHFARQTMYDIFIDSAIYEKKNENEKADIILNEFLTSLYTLKFFTDEQLCNFAKEEYKDAVCTEQKKNAEGESAFLDEDALSTDSAVAESDSHSEQSDAKIEKDLKESKTDKDKKETVAARSNDLPKKDTAATKERKALEREDYINIERVVKFIQDQKEHLTHASLLTSLRENDFDLRVFSIKMKHGKKTADVDVIEKESIESLFAQAKHLSASKRTCFFIQSDENAECQVEMIRRSVEVPDSENTLFLKMLFKIADKNVISETVYQMPKIKIMKIANPTTKKDNYLIPLIGVGLEHPEEGTAYRVNYFVASKVTSESEEKWSLEGVLSVPGTVTKVTIDETSGKAKCEGKLTETKDHASDLVLLADSDQNIELIKAAGDKLSVRPPCW